MKIEVTCSFCRVTLRLDEAHAGKQARCPNCGSLTFIPDGSKPTDSTGPTSGTPTPGDIYTPSNEPFSNSGSGAEPSQTDAYTPPAPVYRPTSHQRPAVERDYQGRPITYLRSDGLSTKSDGHSKSALFLAVISCFLVMGCFPLGIVTIIFGFNEAYRSRSKLRTFARGILAFALILLVIRIAFLG